jgi:hypothetical protein
VSKKHPVLEMPIGRLSVADAENLIANLRAIGDSVKLLQTEIERGLPGFEQLFRTTGNAYFAWATWGLCRSFGAPVPAWVLRYMDGGGDRLFAQQCETPEQIVAAMKLRVSKGARSAAMAFNQFVADHEIYTAVATEMKRQRGKLDLAVKIVAERLEKPKSTIDVAVRRARTVGNYTKDAPPSKSKRPRRK